MNGVPLLLLFIYSGFTINIVLQCAIGIKGVAESRKAIDLESIIKTVIIFFTVNLMWFFFSMVIYPLIPGISVYILLFPVSALVYSYLEYIIFRYLLKKEAENESIISFPGGFTAAAVFICINISNNITETLLLSFGFTSGIFLVNFIIMEIRRRAALEAIPEFLRGKPLVLIAMGLLSLIFTTASLLIFRMISAE
jgi:electron transport complex protein RnfA